MLRALQAMLRFSSLILVLRSALLFVFLFFYPLLASLLFFLIPSSLLLSPPWSLLLCSSRPLLLYSSWPLLLCSPCILFLSLLSWSLLPSVSATLYLITLIDYFLMFSELLLLGTILKGCRTAALWDSFCIRSLYLHIPWDTAQSVWQPQRIQGKTRG